MAPLFCLGSASDKWGQFLWLGTPGLWNSMELSDCHSPAIEAAPMLRFISVGLQVPAGYREAQAERTMAGDAGYGEARRGGQRRQGNAIESSSR